MNVYLDLTLVAHKSGRDWREQPGKKYCRLMNLRSVGGLAAGRVNGMPHQEQTADQTKAANARNEEKVQGKIRSFTFSPTGSIKGHRGSDNDSHSMSFKNHRLNIT